MLPRVAHDFTWRDGERIVRFGRGALAQAPELLGDGYVLLTTAARRGVGARRGRRRRGRAPRAGRARRRGRGRPARAPSTAPCSWRSAAAASIDVAKALAAARGADAAAIPTTLSAAEMTRGHRHARGVDPRDAARAAADRGQRPGPVRLAARGRARRVGRQRARPRDRGPADAAGLPRAGPRRARGGAPARRASDDRDALALGALLAGYVIDSTGYGLHHVLSQTLARFAGVWHGHANAAMLPHTTVALRRRAPDVLAALDAAAGVPMEALARRLAQRAGAQQLRDLGVTEEALETCVRGGARARPRSRRHAARRRARRSSAPSTRRPC